MIQTATEWWLEYEDALAEGEDAVERYKFLAAEVGLSNLEQPEPLSIMRMLRNMGIQFWAGGLADQPYFLLMEMNAAAAGEKAHRQRKMQALSELK